MVRMTDIPEHDTLPALTQGELDDLLRKHKKYLIGQPGGGRLVLKYKDLSNLDFRKLDCSQADFTGCKMRNANLSHGLFEGVSFFSCDLQFANLESSDFRNADFRGAMVSGANLANANLAKADLREGQIMISDRTGLMSNRKNASADGRAVFDGARLCEANLQGMRAQNASFAETDLSGADLTHANLSRASFKEANLSDADFSGSDMSNSDLSGSIMTGAVLEQIGDRNLKLSGIVTDETVGKRLESLSKSLEELLAEHRDWLLSAGKRGERLDLSDHDLRDVLNLKSYPLTAIRALRSSFLGQDLRGAEMQSVECDGADFRDCEMEGADMRGSSFRQANFVRADLRGALLSPLDIGGQDDPHKLKRTDLSGADFSHAVLEGADLHHAVFAGADLKHAVLRGCDLRHANLKGADLDGAVLEDVLLDHAIIDEGAVLDTQDG